MSKPTLALYRQRWQQRRSQALLAWGGLSVREKRLVAGCALVLAGLLLWAVMIAPALKKIDYWQVETPKLRAQAQTLETLLHEAGIDAQRPTEQSQEQLLRQTLDDAGLKDRYQLQQHDQAGLQSWQLTFEQAPADAMVGWLLGTPRQFSLHVVEASLQRAEEAPTQDSAGTLSGVVRMDQAQDAKEAS